MRTKRNMSILRRILLGVAIAVFVIAGLDIPLLKEYEEGRINGGYAAVVEAAGEDTSWIDIDGDFETPDRVALIARVNEMRYEACVNGYRNPETGTPLSLSDYREIGWNSNMEGLARIRAVEALVYMAHTKPNGKSTFTTSYNGKTSGGEILAWNDSLALGLEAWYSEITDYLNGDYSSNTGHYQLLISPSYNSIGFAGFESDDVDIAYNLGCYSGELGYDKPDNTTLGSYGKNTVSVEVMNSRIRDMKLVLNMPLLPVGKSIEAVAEANLTYNGVWTTGTKGVIKSGVIWESDDPSVASVDANGKITGKSAGYTTIRASLDVNGSTYSDSKRIIVTNGDVSIVGIVEPDPINGKEGFLPTLPDTVLAKLSDGQTLEVPVTWNMSGYTRSSFATLDGKKVVINGEAEGYEVSITVQVPAAEVDDISVEVDEVTIESGESFSPTTMKVYVHTTSNFSWTSYATWDSAAYTYYKKREGGTFRVHGVCHGHDVYFTLHVNPATVESAALTSNEITVISGTKPTYPETATVRWSNGDVTKETITWNKTEQDAVGYMERKDASYTVSGKVQGKTVLFRVNVTAASAEQAYLSITSVTANSGSVPNYPQTAKITWSNGFTTDEPITWNKTEQAAVNYKSRTGGTYTVSGTVQGKTVQVTVKIAPATVMTAYLEKTSITVESGTAPTYPTTAKVTWSNSDVTSEPVTWNSTEVGKVNYKAMAGGKYLVSGTVKGKSVTLTVIVNPATIKSIYLDSDEMTVISGTKPIYPGTANIRWSNGDITKGTITWNKTEQAAVNYTDRKDATYTVSGTVQGYTVSIKIHVTPASASQANLTVTSVTASSGSAPSYPATAKVTWSNGLTTDEPITWNKTEQAAVNYNSRTGGTYTVTGTVQGKKVQVTVKISPATVVSASLEKTSVTVESGTVPAYPTTAKVTWSNGDVTSEAVTWNSTEVGKVNYKAAAGGKYQVSGTVKGKTVTYTVVVNPAKVVSTELISKEMTVSGGASPVFPSAKVTWSNGDVTTETVTWNTEELAAIDFNSKEEKTYTLTGTVRGKTVTVTVNVCQLPDVTVSYRTHVQTYGWQKFVSDGVMAGTSGQSKRLEGIEIKVSGNDNLGIQYTTHCQTYGWLPWSANGEMNGTEGESKRLEAIEIRLVGADADLYDVYYRVHAQTYGWLGWAKNGEPSGTAGQSKRLEGIQIVVQKKGLPEPTVVEGIKSNYRGAYKVGDGQSQTANVGGSGKINVAVTTHVQTYGWQGWRYNGNLSGTSGESKRLEGIRLKLTNNTVGGGITYRTNVQGYGWMAWKSNGAMAGTSGESKRLEAIQIQLTGEMAKKYDVYYRVHSQRFGWLGWAKNGQTAGTVGYNYRLESIQVVLVEKGGAAPGAKVAGISGPTNAPSAYEK